MACVFHVFVVGHHISSDDEVIISLNGSEFSSQMLLVAE